MTPPRTAARLKAVNPELWTSDPRLAALSLLPVPLGALWLALAPRLPWAKRPRGAAALAWLTWLATRAAFAALVWGVLGHRSVDATAFFLPQAGQAARGLLPYRDFASAYAPLFPALLATALRLLGASGPLTLFLLADLAAWRLLAARERDREALALAGAAWAYLAFPPVWYFAVRYAQDETLAAMCVAGALLAHERDRPVRLGLWLALGLLATKPLFALAAVPFLVAPGSGRWRALIAMALPVAAVYGALLALGAPVWQPLELEGGSFGIGPTLWRVPVVLAGWDPGALGWAPFAVVALAGAVWLARRRAPPAGQAAWMFGAFALLSPKFMPMYAVMWAPCLAAWVAGPWGGEVGRRNRRRVWWVAYGALLPLAWYLDSGPLQGRFGPAAQGGAAGVLLVIALMAAGLLAMVARGAREESR